MMIDIILVEGVPQTKKEEDEIYIKSIFRSGFLKKFGVEATNEYIEKGYIEHLSFVNEQLHPQCFELKIINEETGEYLFTFCRAAKQIESLRETKKQHALQRNTPVTAP